MIGYNENELIGMEIFSLMDKKSKKIAKNCIINVKEGNKGLNELNLIKKDGTNITALIKISPVLDNKKYIGCLALIFDIT